MKLADLHDISMEIWLRQRAKDSLVWKTKEGDVIPIKNLSDRHLVNIYNMLINIEAQQDLEEQEDIMNNSMCVDINDIY